MLSKLLGLSYTLSPRLGTLEIVVAAEKERGWEVVESPVWKL